MNPTSTDGFCGSSSDTNSTCLNSKFGNCCSSKGFCGETSLYCGQGCQADFGRCSDMGLQSVSTSGTCGSTASNNITCLGSEFGDCCSSLGYCGGNSSYCGTGCQAGFGECSDAEPTHTSSSESPSKPTASATSGNVSRDGNCGSNSDILSTCLGSEWGDCCSHNGFCGGNASYCATGCQSKYGSCDSSSPTGTVSLDGNCGSNSKVHAICLGSQWGDCCSANGYCGGNSTYCGAGCQSGYGNCGLSSTATPSPTSLPSSNGGLGTGAIAGISVGAAIAGCALLGFAAWFAFFRKKQEDVPQDVPKYIPSGTLYSDSKMPAEMSQSALVSEMDGGETYGLVELPTHR